MAVASHLDAEVALPPLAPGPHRARLGVISIVACFGGLLFGYDTGVINGALRPVSAALGLDALTEGVVTSSLVFAAAVGALLGGRLSDALGRRRMLVALAVVFFVGTLVLVLAPGFEAVVAGRVLLGLAVGGASTVVPVYLAELAPFEIRGSISGRNEVAIVVGQLAAFVVNAILGGALGHLDGVWRIMFAVCALPAIALFAGMLRMPESPRWLAARGRHDEALAVLRTVAPRIVRSLSSPRSSARATRPTAAATIGCASPRCCAPRGSAASCSSASGWASRSSSPASTRSCTTARRCSWSRASRPRRRSSPTSRRASSRWSAASWRSR